MHSYEVNIRICQPENRGLTNPDVNRKRMHQLFCYITLHASLFLVHIEYFHIYRFTPGRCPLCTENKIISTTAFQVSEIIMRYGFF